jgi:uncharacterized protein YecT (DUF1311 family)
MMRAINLLALLPLLLMPQIAYPLESSSIYGSTFDYKKAKPTSVYFSGKSHEEIESYCKQEMLGTMDLSACAQFEYEDVMNALNRRASEVEKILEADDKENGKYGEPAALPFFKKAQVNWQLYRDNDCYMNVYSVGQASLRFIDFWSCMTRITQNRLNELSPSTNND